MRCRPSVPGTWRLGSAHPPAQAYRDIAHLDERAEVSDPPVVEFLDAGRVVDGDTRPQPTTVPTGTCYLGLGPSKSRILQRLGVAL